MLEVDADFMLEMEDFEEESECILFICLERCRHSNSTQYRYKAHDIHTR